MRGGLKNGSVKLQINLSYCKVMKSIFKVEDRQPKPKDWSDRAPRAIRELARRAKITSRYDIAFGCGLPLPILEWLFNNDTGRMVGAVLPSGSMSEAKNLEFEHDLLL